MKIEFKYRDFSVKTKFLYWTCFCVIISLTTLSTIIYQRQKSTIWDTTQKTSSQIIAARSLGIGTWISGLKNEMTLLASTQRVRSMDWNTMRPILMEFMERRKDIFGFVGFSLIDGTCYTSINGKATSNVKQRSFFSDIINKNMEFSISNPEISKTTNMLSFFISVPIKDEKNEVIGVLYGNILFDTISKFISTIKIGQTSYAWIVDENGTMIVHPEKKYIMKMNIKKSSQFGFKKLDELAANILQQNEGNGEIISPSGKIKMIYYSKIDQTPEWTLGITEDRNELIAPATKVLYILIGTGIAALILIILTIIILTNKIIVKPLHDLIGTTKKLAKGHLYAEYKVHCKDDIGTSAMALKNMQEKLRELVSKVSTSADAVAVGSTEISSSAEVIASGAAEQASSIEEMSASIEQMFMNIQESSETACSTEKISNNIAIEIENVAKATQSSLSGTKEILEKINIISEIASKTDLLAINASIEAASAGEHGKGFAIVAFEIRKLAELSKSAAQEINSFSKKNLKIADEASHRMEEIVPMIQENTKMVRKISSLSVEQLNGAHQINDTVQELAQIAQTNSASAEELATSSEELSALANQLKDTLQFFKLEECQDGDADEIIEEIRKHNNEIARLQSLLVASPEFVDKRLYEKSIFTTSEEKQENKHGFKLNLDAPLEDDEDFVKY